MPRHRSAERRAGPRPEAASAVADSLAEARRRDAERELTRAEWPQVFVSTGVILKTTAADALAEWIDRDRLRSAYFLVLIRPNGLRTFDALEETLRGKSISFGFDLIDADRTVLHPERGAAP